MKRSMDLCRGILQAVEREHTGPRWSGQIQIEGYNEYEIAYHIELLKDAAYLEARVDRAMGNYIGHQIFRLTMSGHDFLAASRKESIWEKAKEYMTAKGYEFTLKNVYDILEKLVAAELGM